VDLGCIYVFFYVFFNFASKSGSVVGKGFWERETLPKSIKIKNRIQNHKKTYSKPFKKLSHFPNHKKIVLKTIKKTISHFLNLKKHICKS
jgi:hypothetical protein